MALSGEKVRSPSIVSAGRKAGVACAAGDDHIAVNHARARDRPLHTYRHRVRIERCFTDGNRPAATNGDRAGSGVSCREPIPCGEC